MHRYSATSFCWRSWSYRKSARRGNFIGITSAKILPFGSLPQGKTYHSVGCMGKTIWEYRMRAFRLSSLILNVKRKSLSNHAQKGGTALAIGAIPPDLKLLPCNWNRSWLQGVTGNLTLAELGRTPCGLQAVLLAPVLQKPLICKRFRAISVELTSNLTRKCTINLVC